ncbi:MAG TPA: hypothetical protein ENK21_10825 [Trueperaceae bacterium]|nr:hypothetical protein [Trueperaceae bacterium]
MAYKAKKTTKKNNAMEEALEVVSKEATTRLNVEVPESRMDLLKLVVAGRKMTIREYVNDLLGESLEKDVDALGLKIKN